MLIYGRNPVFEALKKGQVTQLYVAKGVEESLIDALDRFDVPIAWVSRIEMDQEIGTTRHQGVIAEIEELHWSDLDTMLKLAETRNQHPLLVLLDGITDPRNFGAIIRCAEALGAHGVVVEERRSAPLSATVAKASAGAIAHLPVAQTKNLPRLIDQLKQQKFWIYGAAGEAPTHADGLDYNHPVALVIGSEGEGLRRLVREKCDECISISLRGETSSLNASVAAGILIYQISLGRKPR